MYRGCFQYDMPSYGQSQSEVLYPFPSFSQFDVQGVQRSPPGDPNAVYAASQYDPQIFVPSQPEVSSGFLPPSDYIVRSIKERQPEVPMMYPALSEYDMRSFTTELTTQMYRTYFDHRMYSIPSTVDPVAIKPQLELERKYVPDIAGYVYFLGTLLRPKFEPIYERAFPSCIKAEGDFLKYSIMCCERLRRDHLEYITCVSSQLEFGHQVQFLVMCAFIFEFVLYCFRQGCFRYACTAKNCILAVYSRFFRTHCYYSSDLRNLGNFCSKRLEEIWANGMSTTDVFIKYSLGEDRLLFCAMVSGPVSRCLEVDLDKIADYPCTEEERKYIICDYIRKNDRDFEHKTKNCSYCGYSCLIHLSKLLFFTFLPSNI